MALDKGDKDNKLHLDKMVAIRQQLRNFVAHGAFGKEGEAFHFHSRAGAVPVIFDSTRAKNRFSVTETLGFNNAEALAAIEEFIGHLWSREREPARIYIQESGGLPTILTMATDGKYATAMQSISDMEEFISYMLDLSDAHTNMDR
jgi:phosphoribosyl-AMP cyclohydrolase